MTALPFPLHPLPMSVERAQEAAQVATSERLSTAKANEALIRQLRCELVEAYTQIETLTYRARSSLDATVCDELLRVAHDLRVEFKRLAEEVNALEADMRHDARASLVVLRDYRGTSTTIGEVQEAANLLRESGKRPVILWSMDEHGRIVGVTLAIHPVVEEAA